MNAHTRGPWSIATGRGASGGISHAGGFVAFTAAPREVSDERGEGESWLEMRDRTQAARDAVKNEEAANARLIALAPEMLEALKDAYPHIENDALRSGIGALIIAATGAA